MTHPNHVSQRLQKYVALKIVLLASDYLTISSTLLQLSNYALGTIFEYKRGFKSLDNPTRYNRYRRKEYTTHKMHLYALHGQVPK